jgi:hypothetical protein
MPCHQQILALLAYNLTLSSNFEERDLKGSFDSREMEKSK